MSSAYKSTKMDLSSHCWIIARITFVKTIESEAKNFDTKGVYE